MARVLTRPVHEVIAIEPAQTGDRTAPPFGGAAARGCPTGDPDDDVRGLLRQGEREVALRLVMARHGDEVHRYCRTQLRDPALADDVHQQIFIEAHRDLASFGGRSTLRIWLFAIARHRVLDAAKARRRAAAHLDDDADALDPLDPRPSALDQLDDAQLHAALATALHELRDDVRAAVLLHYQQGFTFAQMAEICDEKPGTLHARVVRALPVLRRCIEARLAIGSRRSRR